MIEKIDNSDSLAPASQGLAAASAMRRAALRAAAPFDRFDGLRRFLVLKT
jgi:hypothetical protein